MKAIAHYFEHGNYLSGEGMELVDVAEKAAQSTYSQRARQP
jgi:hypothetical protein